MEIRSGEKGDAKAIADIIKRHFESDYMGFANFDGKYIAEKMKKDAFFVAEDGRKMIGCTRISFVDTDLAEIRTLCVDEEYRQKRIGQELLDKSVELLKERKMRKIIARTRADNNEAVKFFEKNGFEQEGYFREHYRKGIDVIQFCRFL